MAQLHATRREPHGEGDRRPDRRDHVEQVPDPKLPTMDVYILPKHIWGKLDAKAITKYPGKDGVGSGPFSARRASSAASSADEGEPDTTGAASRRSTRSSSGSSQRRRDGRRAQEGRDRRGPRRPGRVRSAARRRPRASSPSRASRAASTSSPSTAARDQRVEEIGNGNPALSDFGFRQAIAHAIDKKTLIDRVSAPGSARRPTHDQPVRRTRSGSPRSRRPSSSRSTSTRRSRSSTTPATRTRTATAIREMPGGGKDIDLTLLRPLRVQTVARPDAEFVTGWLKDIGIGTKLEVVNDTKLTEIIGKGDYDMFVWGWTPFVDPDPSCRTSQCDQIVDGSEGSDATTTTTPTGATRRTTRSTRQQNVELDQAKRVDIVAPDADPLLRLGGVRRARVDARPAGLPHRSLQGLAAAAGGDRPGASSRTRRRRTPT